MVTTETVWCQKFNLIFCSLGQSILLPFGQNRVDILMGAEKNTKGIKQYHCFQAALYMTMKVCLNKISYLIQHFVFCTIYLTIGVFLMKISTLSQLQPTTSSWYSTIRWQNNHLLVGATTSRWYFQTLRVNHAKTRSLE